MDKILEYLWDFRFVIVLVVGAVLYAAFEWESVKGKLYALMLQAKRLAKDEILKSGDEQAEWVLQKAKLFLPKAILIFLDDDKLRALIKTLFDLAKDYLDDGKFNKTNGDAGE